MKFTVDLSSFSGELLDLLEGEIIGLNKELKKLNPEVKQFFDIIRFSISDELDSRTRGESKPGLKEYQLPDKSEFTGPALLNIAGWAVKLANHGSPEARSFAWRVIAALIFEDSQHY